ncbi:amino acid ABC transporter permease [Paralcaligenes sp. KSB-10]|jgi:polar amino acid transport system permease protein|uniref:amino acid ABC transporter permease n=1 Tax=Paralcaligenes sp. KSB-10 TaxID=2901142 RepID=UPI001E4C0329|nr:amino acid ABC transporter permease [Paralcaligenes sp. KSB-10]UHL65700.1 amino acid ABC transporter permease [Paralcaligenes sp. KSB-10]
MNTHQLLFLLDGFKGTIILSLLAFLFGGLLGFIVSLLKISKNRYVHFSGSIYVAVLQGIPLLVLMGISFYGPSLFGLTLSPLLAATVALTFYASSYFGEIWQGCIKAVPRQQWEASECLGFNKTQRLFLIVLPQAFKLALPPTVGFMVQLVKNTSIASLVVGYAELAYNSKILNNSTFQPFLYFGLAACLYFVICFPLSVLSKKMEDKLKK